MGWFELDQVCLRSCRSQNANGKAAEDVATKQNSVVCLQAFASKDVLKIHRGARREVEREVFPSLSNGRLLSAAHECVGEAWNGNDHHLLVLVIVEHTSEST